MRFTFLVSANFWRIYLYFTLPIIANGIGQVCVFLILNAIFFPNRWDDDYPIYDAMKTQFCLGLTIGLVFFGWPRMRMSLEELRKRGVIK